MNNQYDETIKEVENSYPNLFRSISINWLKYGLVEKFKYVSSKTDNKDTKNFLSEINIDASNEKLKINKILLNRTFILFNVLKSIKISKMHLQYNNDNNIINTQSNKNSENNLFNNTKMFLYYFVENEPSNCALLLCSDFYEFILCLNNSNLQSILEIFLYALIQLYKIGLSIRIAKSSSDNALCPCSAIIGILAALGLNDCPSSLENPNSVQPPFLAE